MQGECSLVVDIDRMIMIIQINDIILFYFIYFFRGGGGEMGGRVEEQGKEKNNKYTLYNPYSLSL